MSMIRLQEMTPQIYTEESRDFQLLCRLYDSVFNGAKFDTDSITELIDTKQCRTTVLQLLQTKLGFFTEKKIDDEKLRKVLECFPILVRNKGSLKAIKETLYLFLRMYSVSSELEIYYLKTPTSSPFTEDEPCVLSNGKFPENNSLVIRIHSFETKPDITVLEEIFKYILPAGINYYIEFDKNVALPDIELTTKDTAELIFVSDNLNSEVRGTHQGLTNKEVKYRVGATNTASIISTDSYVSNRFIGYYSSWDDAEQYLETLDEKLYSVAIINAIPYICYEYSDGIPYWGEIEFQGEVTAYEISQKSGVKTALKGMSTPVCPLIRYNGVYLLRIGDEWQECNYARYILQTITLPRGMDK